MIDVLVNPTMRTHVGPPRSTVMALVCYYEDIITMSNVAQSGPLQNRL